MTGYVKKRRIIAKDKQHTYLIFKTPIICNDGCFFMPFFYIITSNLNSNKIELAYLLITAEL